jgi:WD40 repeat protein
VPPLVENYEVLEELGQGGMGVVYKARQVPLNRMVALKMIRTTGQVSASELARFRVEAEAVARLRHPHIVQIYEIGEAGGLPYVALEYLDGGTLANRLRGVPQPPRPSAQLVEVLARAMQHAHEQGVIHRDLKPSNVLLTFCGGSQNRLGPPAPFCERPQNEIVPKITDFGLAKLAASGADPTLSGAILGTPSYMAPEQAAGKVREVCAGTDVWALGALLYEMLTGRPPFRGETAQDTLLQVLTQEPVAPARLQPRLPADLDTICLKCLEKDPAARYASAAALAEDLAAFVEGRPIRARPAGVVKRTVKWARRRPSIAALSLALLLVVMLAFALVTWQWAEARTERQNAVARAEAEAAAHERAQRLAALLALDRGIGLCEQGEAGRGLLWLVRSLRLAPGDAEDIRRAARANLGAWYPSVHALQAYRPQRGITLHVAVRPDGRAVLSGGLEHFSELWDPVTGKSIARIEQGGPLFCAAFSPDGKVLALADGPQDLQLRDARTGRLLRRLAGHRGAVRAIAFSPDSRTVLTGSEDRTAQWWDVDRGSPRGKPLKHAARVVAVAFQPDGGIAATGAEDGTARRWDLGTGEPLGAPLMHAGKVMALAFRRDGLLLTGSWDGTAQLWNAAKGTRIGRPLVHASKVLAVAFSPDGQTMLTGSFDHTARLWNARTGEPLGAPLLHQFGVHDAVFSPDGKAVLTGCWGPSVRRWRVSPRHPERRVLAHPRRLEAVAFRPGGKVVVTGSIDRKVRFWDVASGQLRDKPRLALGPVRGLAFSPDGKTLAVVGGRAPGSTVSSTRGVQPVGQVELWQGEEWRPAGKPWKPPSAPRCAAFSPDGKTLLAGTWDGTAWLWNLGARRGRALRGHTFETRSVAFGLRGAVVLTGGNDHVARLWDAKAGQARGVLKHQDLVVAVALSRDGKMLLTGSYDRTAQLWDRESCQRRGQPLEHQSYVHAAVFSPDDRTVLTGSEDRTARLWDARTCRAIGPPLHHGSVVRSAAFSPDGRHVATAGDRDACLWPVPAVVAGDDETLQLWVEVRTGLKLDAEGGVRLLSPGEWEQRRRRLEGASVP